MPVQSVYCVVSECTEILVSECTENCCRAGDLARHNMISLSVLERLLAFQYQIFVMAFSLSERRNICEQPI